MCSGYEPDSLKEKDFSSFAPVDVVEIVGLKSAFGIKQITDKTQKGQLPDGGRLRPYKKSTKKSRSKRGRQVGFVDLTDSGRMFRSLTSKITKSKGTLFFRRNEENKKAFFHDTGTRFMDSRPFFAIGRRDEDKIRDIFFRSIKI